MRQLLIKADEDNENLKSQLSEIKADNISMVSLKMQKDQIKKEMREIEERQDRNRKEARATIESYLVKIEELSTRQPAVQEVPRQTAIGKSPPRPSTQVAKSQSDQELLVPS